MKKYETPVLEIIPLKDFCEDFDYSQGNDIDAKQNIFIFEDFEEEPDTTSIWNSDPWKTKYNLWDEE